MTYEKAKKLTRISLITLVVSVGLMALTALPPMGTKPKFECVEKGAPSSGFSDPKQNNCPVSAESVKAVYQWKKGILGDATYVVRRVLAVVFLAAVVGSITGAVMSAKAKKRRKQEEVQQQQQ